MFSFAVFIVEVLVEMLVWGVKDAYNGFLAKKYGRDYI